MVYLVIEGGPCESFCSLQTWYTQIPGQGNVIALLFAVIPNQRGDTRQGGLQRVRHLFLMRPMTSHQLPKLDDLAYHLLNCFPFLVSEFFNILFFCLISFFSFVVL